MPPRAARQVSAKAADAHSKKKQAEFDAREAKRTEAAAALLAKEWADWHKMKAMLEECTSRANTREAESGGTQIDTQGLEAAWDDMQLSLPDSGAVDGERIRKLGVQMMKKLNYELMSMYDLDVLLTMRCVKDGDVRLNGQEPVLLCPVSPQFVASVVMLNTCDCDDCDKTEFDNCSSKYLMCAGCEGKRYCGKECQARDWELSHRMWCPHIRSRHERSDFLLRSLVKHLMVLSSTVNPGDVRVLNSPGNAVLEFMRRENPETSILVPVLHGVSVGFVSLSKKQLQAFFGNQKMGIGLKETNQNIEFKPTFFTKHRITLFSVHVLKRSKNNGHDVTTWKLMEGPDGDVNTYWSTTSVLNRLAEGASGKMKLENLFLCPKCDKGVEHTCGRE